MNEKDTNTSGVGQQDRRPGGQDAGQAGGGTGQPSAGNGSKTPQGGEDRSFQGAQGDPAEGADTARVDTDGDGRTRDPNDTRSTDDGGRGAPVER